MKLKSFKPVPVLIAAITIGLAAFFHSATFSRHFDFFEQLEWRTYDLRMKQAAKSPHPIATNLAVVFIDEESLETINDAYQFTWPWPRSLHGRLINELSAQGAAAVGFDILFKEIHLTDAATEVKISESEIMSSDEFFAAELRKSSNTVLAAMSETTEEKWKPILPADLFFTNALAVGHITTDKDSDGVLRRALAFRDVPGHGRIWHMAIILAARSLGLDLSKAEVARGKITLRGKGMERAIPTDPDGFFYIDWNIPWNDVRMASASYPVLLNLNTYRLSGRPEKITEYLNELRTEGKTNLFGDAPFKNKIVVVGATAAGNNISDVGATPLSKETYLVSKHWNIANSIITNHFIRRSSFPVDLLLIVFLGILAAALTLQLRALSASLSVVALIAIYIAAAFFLFMEFRYWIPIVLPVIGALLMTHVCMVTYRVRVEQKERRRVKAVFSKIVSPNVVNELLNTEKLSLQGARRKITVFFADVRGFTEMTDSHQARAEEYVREHNLTGDAAEAYFDQQAHETLDTVNLYLSTIADKVKEHRGTLDKYIGDCVMAFWGAPTANEQHALSCVRAAIDAQRAMYELNQQRALENKRREAENVARVAASQPPLYPLPLLALGTGINTGTTIVGLMGSDAHILNYTVFGREVNLASRLEGVSGRGRIVIGESTFEEIQRDDPQLAATCVALKPEKVKGFRNEVKIYEVPWKVDLAISKTESTETSPAAQSVQT